MTESSVERTLGILLAKVEGIERELHRGNEHRALVHKRVDEVVQEIGELRTDLAVMKTDVADTKAVTDDVKKWKLMGMGALGVTGVAFASIGSVVTYFANDILAWFRPPP